MTKSKLRKIKGWMLVNKNLTIPSAKTRERYKIYRRKGFAKGKAKENKLTMIEVEITIKKK